MTEIERMRYKSPFARCQMYHVALCFGLYHGKHRKGTVVVQMRRNIDFLSEEVWKYLGKRFTTKKLIREQSKFTLEWINKEFGTDFKHLIVD